MEMQEEAIRDGGLSQLAFGGQFGRKGIKDVFEGKQNNIEKSKINCLGLYYFWCKQVVIGDIEDVFNVIE